MKATCVIVANPFNPGGSSRQTTLTRPLRLRALAPKGQPVVACLNGRIVMRAEWRRRLAHGDQVEFVRLPAGQGGGAGGSNPMRTLLTIALMAFSGGAAGAAFGGFLTGGAAAVAGISSATLGTLAITLAGSAAINALFPGPGAGQGQRSLAAPSPTYSLGAQGNAARIGTVIPVQYGRMLAWPDLAAQPYTEFAGDQQYLYQLLCLGCGLHDIEEIRIEDTPVSAFTEIETQIVGPGEQVTLFPTAVVTSDEVSGQELTGRKTVPWTASAGMLTFTQTAHGRAVGQALKVDAVSGTLTAGFYAIASVPTDDTFTVVIAGASGSGSAHLRVLVGGMTGFIASASGTVAHHLGLDLILPSGLHGLSSAGALTDKSLTVVAQAQRVGDTGAAIGLWLTLATETITDRTNTPVRKSLRYEMATPGRYRVRMWRDDEKDTDAGVGHEVIWFGLRSYLREPADFGNVTLIAMRARATGNLSAQASRRVSVISTRKLPIWNGTAWSAPTPTRSIAWAIADAGRATGYGPGLPDAEINLAGLLALDAVWTGRGDCFDGRFDQAGTWWAAVQSLARVGRAQCFLQGGILQTVRDGPVTIPQTMFSERNIIRDSFVVDYVLHTSDTAEAIKLSYFDAATWSQQSVTCALPGRSLLKPAKDQMIGITSRAHALREGTYLAACNDLRRRVARFSTELEGRIPSVGDLVAIQHSDLGWAQQAEALAWASVARRLTVSEPLDWTGVGTAVAILRRRDGSVCGPIAVTRGAVDAELIFATSPDFTPETGSEAERTHVVFGFGEAWSARAKIARIEPKSLYEYDIQAVIEDPSVHVADVGLTAPPINYSQLPGFVTQPVVTGLMARRIPDDPNRALFAWSPAPNAETYQMEMAEGDDPSDPNVSWTRIADTTSASLAALILYPNRTMIRIRGIGLTAGPWIKTTLGTLIPDFWLNDSAPFWLADGDPFWSN